jgi:hypothetical protein
MRQAERVLAVATALLIAAVIVLCWAISDGPQSNTDSGIPWPIVWGRIAFEVASVFALVGLASAAGLLFLRAVRWTDPPTGDGPTTPES